MQVGSEWNHKEHIETPWQIVVEIDTTYDRAKAVEQPVFSAGAGKTSPSGQVR